MGSSITTHALALGLSSEAPVSLLTAQLHVHVHNAHTHPWSPGWQGGRDRLRHWKAGFEARSPGRSPHPQEQHSAVQRGLTNRTAQDKPLAQRVPGGTAQGTGGRLGSHTGGTPSCLSPPTVHPDPGCHRFPAFPGGHGKPPRTPLCCTDRPTGGMLLAQDASKTGCEPTAGMRTRPNRPTHVFCLACKVFFDF